MHKILLLITIVTLSILTLPCHAKTSVLEGSQAQELYQKVKTSAQTLNQENTKFTLIEPNGTQTIEPESITVKIGEYFFITNIEHKIVHNVYDEEDHSWVLKKQQPGGIAAIAFDTAGIHKLRCAIHPQMKVTINVIP